MHKPILSSLACILMLALVVSARAATSTPYDTINAAAASATIQSSALRGGLTVLFGSGGNITVLSGADGKLLVDGGIALSKTKLMAALNTIGHAPIKYLVNTHWHWDHTDGNEWLHNAGATIIASPQTRHDLQSTIRIEEWGHTFTPLPPAALPTELVSKEKILDFDREHVVIRLYKPSHTNGDLRVYFTRADVLATGDTYWNRMYPFIDTEVGGGIDGMIRAADVNITAAGDNTIIVPGHGPLSGKQELVEYRDMLLDIRNNIWSLKSKGQSEKQVIAQRPTARYDEIWGKSVINPALFVHLVYISLPSGH